MTCDSYTWQAVTGLAHQFNCTLPRHHVGDHEARSGDIGAVSWLNRDDTIRALHQPITDPRYDDGSLGCCAECEHPYPCATIRALNGQTP